MRALLLMALALLLATGAAAAAPWLAAGDEQLRRDVDLLAGSGIIDGPVNAWPLPVAQLCGRHEPVAGAALAAAA